MGKFGVAPALASIESAHGLDQSFHSRLATFNAARLAPGHIDPSWLAELKADYQMRIDEGRFVERERTAVQAFALAAPTDAHTFVEWFEELRQSGKLILTPHVAGWTFDSYRRISEVMATKLAKLKF